MSCLCSHSSVIVHKGCKNSYVARLWLWQTLLWLQLGFGNQATTSLSSVIDSRLLWALSEAIKNQSLSGFLGYFSVSVSFTHMTCVHTEAHWHTSGSLPHTNTQGTHALTHLMIHTHYTVTLTHTDSTSDRCWHTLALIHTQPTHTHTRHTHLHTHREREAYTVLIHKHTDIDADTHNNNPNWDWFSVTLTLQWWPSGSWKTQWH